MNKLQESTSISSLLVLWKQNNLSRNEINFWTNWITVVSATTTGQSRIKRDVVILACRSTGLLKGAPKSNWATIIRKIDNVTIQSSNSNIHYNDELLSCWSNSITVASALWFLGCGVFVFYNQITCWHAWQKFCSSHIFRLLVFGILITLVAWFSFRLAHHALQNVNKDYVIFS